LEREKCPELGYARARERAWALAEVEIVAELVFEL
jgi:hypothetical protein